jgi:hypothetical protein
MIAITITSAAYAALKIILPECPRNTPPPGADGLIRIWLDWNVVATFSRLRGLDESYSDVILRLAKG